MTRIAVFGGRALRSRLKGSDGLEYVLMPAKAGGRDPGKGDQLADPLDLPGHARTMNTGVPTSTCSKSHST